MCKFDKVCVGDTTAQTHRKYTVFYTPEDAAEMAGDGVGIMPKNESAD